jgi:hypothetical protein
MTEEVKSATNKAPISSKVIERFRASKERCDEMNYRLGRDAGEAFVMAEAEAEELEFLEGFLEDIRQSGCVLSDWCNDHSSAYTAAQSLFFAIRPVHDGNRDAAAGFWESVTNCEHNGPVERPRFLEGFVDGAIEVWEEVKAQL